VDQSDWWRDVRAELNAARVVVDAARAAVNQPAWAGVCDEDVTLEKAVRQYDLLFGTEMAQK